MQQQTKAQELQEKLTELELKKKEELAKEKAQQLSLEYIYLVGFPIGPEVLKLVPEEKAQEAQLIPFFHHENQIRLAVVDPDYPGVQEIISTLQKDQPQAHIALYLTSEHSLAQALKLYAAVPKIKPVKYGVEITEEQLTRYTAELKTFRDLEEELPQANMTDAFAMIISIAMNTNASDIHIEAEESDIIVRLRIDGMLQTAAKIPKTLWPRLISRIKMLAGLKINITETPQDGRITILLKNDKIDIRVSTLPEAWGESVVMRLLRSSAAGFPFEELGLRDQALKKLSVEIKKPNGMVVTTGPTGSGKTTTLYAIVNKVNRPEVKIITLEDPIEYKLPGVIQSQVDHARDYTFAKGLRSILRQDPDICLVGEIRDLETAETAIQAALTGHLLLSTLHTNDAAGAIPRFLSMGVKPFLLAPALNAVIGQRLVRKICPKCKVEATLEFELLEKVKKILSEIPENSGEKIPDLKKLKFYKGKGCEACHGLGYKGRIGIYEVFNMNPEIEALTLTGQVSEYQMKEICHKAGMVTMVQDGLLKALDGITSVEEVFRVAD